MINTGLTNAKLTHCTHGCCFRDQFRSYFKSFHTLFEYFFNFFEFFQFSFFFFDFFTFFNFIQFLLQFIPILFYSNFHCKNVEQSHNCIVFTVRIKVTNKLITDWWIIFTILRLCLHQQQHWVGAFSLWFQTHWPPSNWLCLRFIQKSIEIHKQRQCKIITNPRFKMWCIITPWIHFKNLPKRLGIGIFVYISHHSIERLKFQTLTKTHCFP